MTKYSLEQINESGFESFKNDIEKTIKESTKIIGRSIETIFNELKDLQEDGLLKVTKLHYER